MSRKKVVLYNPKAVFYDLPLALLAVGSNLDPNQYEVIIIDGRVESDPFGLIKKHLPDTICFGTTVLTGSPINDALEKTRFVKSTAPQVTTVWGGWHTSLFPKETLEQEQAVDVSVQGQGEITLRELVAAIDEGKTFEHISGICYRKDGEIVKNPARLLKNMNELETINYDLIEPERYFALKGKRQFDYISSTGCYFRCSFCADPFVFGRNFTAVEPEKVAEDLVYYQSKYHFTEVNFQDETLFTYPKRMRTMAEEFIKKDLRISWAGTMRADQAHRMSEEDFALFKRSGLRRVLVGVESGSQEMMDWLQKDIKLEYVFETAERCKRHGIGVIFPFIVGFPGETEKSLNATIQVVKRLNKMAPNFETPIFYFKPYPGSKITNDVVANGYALPETLEEWAKFDYIGSAGPWVDDKMYEFFERFKFYLKLGYGKKRIYTAPLEWVSRQRIKSNRFEWPIEKWMVDKIRPMQKLS